MANDDDEEDEEEDEEEDKPPGGGGRIGLIDDYAGESRCKTEPKVKFFIFFYFSMKERLNFFHARNDHWIGRCNEIFGSLIFVVKNP